MNSLKTRLFSLLKWSERYTKTDMVYIASSGFWLNLNFCFVLVCSFLLSVAFANLLPKTQYGLYQYILATAALLSAFTLTGMNAAITQSVARGYEGVFRSSIRTQLLWNLIPSAIALAAGIYYLFKGNSVLGLGMIFICLSLPLVNAFNSYGAYLAGRKEFKTAALYTLFGNAVYYFFIFICVVLFPTAIPLVIVNLLVTAVMAVVFYKRTVRSFPPNTKEDPDAFSYGRHLSGMNILGTVAANLDKLLVFQFLGAASLASYALAILLPDRLAGGFKPLFLTAFPRFAKRSLTEIRHSIVQKTGLVLLVATLASVLYAIVVPSLIYLVYPNYVEIIPYSQVYAFTFIATAGHLASTALMAHKRLKELYILNTILPLIQIAMLIAGITFWGLWGVIIARVIYSLLFSVSAFGFLKYWRGPDYSSR